MSIRKNIPKRMQEWGFSLHEGCEESPSTTDRVAMIKAFRRPRVRRKLMEHEGLLKTIESVILPLRKKIAVLEEKLKEPVAPTPNAFELWIRSKEAQKYAGEFVAFSGPGIVVAHSPSNDELIDLISNHPQKGELVIDLVPSAAS